MVGGPPDAGQAILRIESSVKDGTRVLAICDDGRELEVQDVTGVTFRDVAGEPTKTEVHVAGIAASLDVFDGVVIEEQMR